MDLRGKVAVIRGGTSGIGRATALMLAERGAEVIVIGRDPAKGASVEAALQKASGGLGGFLQADLSLVSEARRVVGVLTTRLQQIDAFIQSAGIIEFDATTTSEGLDRLFVTNFLQSARGEARGTPLLAGLLAGGADGACAVLAGV